MTEPVDLGVELADYSGGDQPQRQMAGGVSWADLEDFGQEFLDPPPPQYYRHRGRWTPYGLDDERCSQCRRWTPGITKGSRCAECVNADPHA